MDAGADIEMSDYNSPLWIASYKGHQRIVKYLLENGALVDEGDVWEDRAPLFIATTQHHLGVMTILLDYRADPNRANRDHTSPLTAAVYGGDIHSVDLLLARGAVVGMDGTGFSHIHIAKKYGYRDILKSLNAADAKANKMRSNMRSNSLKRLQNGVYGWSMLPCSLLFIYLLAVS